MKKKSQKKVIIDELLKNGIVKRNWCLQNYITRLSHYANLLEQEGWVFEARYSKDHKDYGYIVKHAPFKKSIYKVGGREIVTYSITYEK